MKVSSGEGLACLDQPAQLRNCVRNGSSMHYFWVTHKWFMPQSLRTTPSGGTMPQGSAVIVDMGLRHHLNDYLSSEEGDGKITAYRLAQETGIGRNTIYRICGSPEKSFSWAVLAKLCAALDLQPGELLSFESEGE